MKAKHIQNDTALQLLSYHEPAVVVLFWYWVKEKKIKNTARKRKKKCFSTLPCLVQKSTTDY